MGDFCRRSTQAAWTAERASLGRQRAAARFLGWALLCVALAGCQRVPATSRASAEPPGGQRKIVDGALERDRPAVVFVNDRGGRCTGSLIGQRVVLTAKHCVQDPGAAEPVPASNLSVGVGFNAQNGSMEFYRVADVLVAEGVYTETEEKGVEDLLPNDIALLTLQRSPGIEPLPLSFGDPRQLVGSGATAVGFGQTPSNALGGVKMTTETKIEYVDESAIFVGNTVCPGDSGGPLISDAGEVVGVVSNGIGEECGVGLGFYNRIDLHADLIQQALIRAGEVEGECIATGDEVCDGFDNDCNGEVDEGCLPLGSECSRDDECIGGQCDETPMGRLCTASCDPVNPSLACPEGLRCANSGDCEGYCVPGDLGGKGYDEACSSDDECASLLCVDPGDGNRRCLSACRSGYDGCFAGEACVAAAGECGPCALAALVNGPLGFGEPCADDERCRSGLCLEDEGVSYCSAQCDVDGDCADSAHCRGGHCLRGTASLLGGACQGQSDCAAGLFCSASTGTGFCTRQCGDVADCGDGFQCSAVANGDACVPQRAVLGARCSADADCVTHLCDAPSGTCSRTCSQNAACGSGFECVRRDDGSEEGRCLSGDIDPPRSSSQGCHSGPGGAAAWWLAVGLVPLLSRRRRT